MYRVTKKRSTSNGKITVTNLQPQDQFYTVRAHYEIPKVKYKTLEDALQAVRHRLWGHSNAIQEAIMAFPEMANNQYPTSEQYAAFIEDHHTIMGKRTFPKFTYLVNV